MTKQLVNKNRDTTYLVEGSSSDQGEPTSPLKTTAIPAFRGATDLNGIQSSETGVSEAYNKAEGKDMSEDQDATLRSGETEAVPEKNVNGFTRKPRVLIVEDTTELAEVIQATLENMDIEASYATHGTRAIEKLKSMMPDVILLDIGLPDMIGWKILDNIKEIYSDPDAGTMPTVIVITAYGDPANRLVAKLQGIYSYLVKPFTPDEVETVVRGALSSSTGT